MLSGGRWHVLAEVALRFYMGRKGSVELEIAAGAGCTGPRERLCRLGMIIGSLSVCFERFLERLFYLADADAEGKEMVNLRV